MGISLIQMQLRFCLLSLQVNSPQIQVNHFIHNKVPQLLDCNRYLLICIKIQASSFTSLTFTSIHKYYNLKS